MKTTKIIDRKIEPFSVLSFSISIISFGSFFTSEIPYIELLFLPGTVFGHISRHIIKNRPLLGGSGIALAGITVGYAIPAMFIITRWMRM